VAAGPAFNRLKQFRAVATRYDKLKSRYEATVTVASIVILLRAKPDRKTSRSGRWALRRLRARDPRPGAPSEMIEVVRGGGSGQGSEE